jgi:hypothetical protein
MIKLLSSRISNIIYTDGILTGLTLKQYRMLFAVRLFGKVYMKKLVVPLWILSYNRAEGLRIRGLVEASKKMRDDFNKDSEGWFL